MKEAKKDLWLLPNEICIAQGHSVAKNLLFESRKHHKLFLKLWDKYLGEMTEVFNYHLSPDGWAILFKAKSEHEIKKAYLKQRRKSKKANSKLTLQAPKRMLSEHIRIFLSQYVRKLNRKTGRKGGLVMERFRKYIVKHSADYHRIFKILTNQVRFPSQKLEKYRPDEGAYDVHGKMKNGSIWQTGKRYYEGVLGLERVLGCMRIVRPESSVLRKFYTSRKRIQNSS